MKLIPRNRHQRRSKDPRIAISEAEISADLHYPAVPRPGDPTMAPRHVVR